jgi:hypothetical protein
MANWTERNRYQASWGAWYVQVEIDGQNVELKFQHSPTAEEIEPIAQQLLQSMQPPTPTIEVVAEDGVVL